MSRSIIPVAPFILTLLGACAAPPTDSPTAGESLAAGNSGIELANFDPSVRPQDDFYRHVNGRWLDTFVIPADQSNYGSFTKLSDDAEKNLLTILEELTLAPGDDPTARKLADAFAAFMDTAAADAAGLTPVAADRKAIADAASRDDIARLMGQLFAVGVASPLVMWIDQDAKEATRYAVYLQQGGLGLPDRDYYFEGDAKFQETRAAYLRYIADLLALAGATDGAARAQRIFALETKLAEHHWTRADTRDREKAYNKLDLAGLTALAPTFPWQPFLSGLGVDAAEYVILRQPTYAAAMAQIFNDTPLEEWKSYLEYALLNTAAPYLAQPFVELDFAFYKKTLRGIDEDRARWKRGVAYTEGMLGEALGKIYVARHFEASSMARMQQLVANLRRAFAEGIDTLEWMTPVTKAKAHDKLAKFSTKIGYPDTWRDYSDLVIRPGDILGNLWRGRRFEHRYHAAKLGKPVDRNEWFMYPQTVNAYYNPPMNEIVFPAAILQPPFFNPTADDAANYGAIGAVIGHELSHGFDDQGRKSDGDGNLRDWWSESDAQEFQARAAKLVAQYNRFAPIEGMQLNGELTLGENIGDLGGLTIAYRAYQLSLQGQAAPVIDGLTGDQRFFAGWSQIWRRKYRDAELRRRLLTDPHSPSRYRVIGVLANMPEFYAAFALKEGDAMFLPTDKRVKIW